MLEEARFSLRKNGQTSEVFTPENGGVESFQFLSNGKVVIEICPDDEESSLDDGEWALSVVDPSSGH